MTVGKLVELTKERDRITAALATLEPYIQTQETANRVLKAVKQRKQLHWTQTPKGRKRMSQISKQRHWMLAKVKRAS